MIQVINPQLDATFLDCWGEYLPFAIRPWLPIIDAGCFVPRWFQAPLNSLQNMVIGDYNSWSLQIPPGSFILQVTRVYNPATGKLGQTPHSGRFQVQITDTILDYPWFSQPIPDSLFWKRDGRNAHVLPKPYPVLSPGNFQVERWCTETGSCELLFVVAVPEVA